MTTKHSAALPIVVLAVILALSSGCSTRSSSESTVSGGATAPDVSVSPGKIVSEPQNLGAPYGRGNSYSGAPQESQGKDPLIITTASISLEVDKLEPTVSAIRDIATRYGASISNLSVSAGGDGPPPQPLDGSSSYPVAVTPGSATVTLKVPAARLDAAQKDIAALGTVKLQSSAQDDVTQQHVDMAARLKNLQAEEARLRAFFSRATKVSEMLSIEQELSRVRGEIESMQAQINYLERQAARATLTVTISEPGGLVSPGAGGWGFAQAFRDGVRAAAEVTKTLITFLLAFSPMLLLALVLWFAVRSVLRARRRRLQVADPGDTLPRGTDTVGTETTTPDRHV